MGTENRECGVTIGVGLWGVDRLSRGGDACRLVGAGREGMLP